MKIGFAGVGRMGAAMAARLAGLGREVTVWNRTPQRARALEASGCKVAASPEALVAASDLVVTILADEKAVEEVHRALLPAGGPGKLLLEMSTTRPQAQQRFAAAARSRGWGYVECPVGGSVGPAKDGKLFGFAGGEAADVARARPLLEQLCRRVEHLGPVGAGSSMKLAINLPLLVYWQALGEALALVRPLGLEPARLVDILADTSGAPNMMKIRGPMIAAALAGKDNPVTVDVATLRKDLSEMVAEAHGRGFRAPVTERVLECFDAAIARGMAAADCTALPVAWSAAPEKLS